MVKWESTELSNMKKRNKWSKWIGLLLCSTLVLSSCGSKTQNETQPESGVSQTESISETESQSVEKESPSETESIIETEAITVTETEHVSESETVKESEAQSTEPSESSQEAQSSAVPDFTVISSIYEDINMGWADVCMLVLDCVLTTPVSYAGDPVFAAMYCNGAVEPLVITGHQTPDQAGNYYIYSFVDGKRVYQLGNYVGIFYWNQAADRLCLQVSATEFQVYAYQSNHMILLETSSALPEGYSVLGMHPLNVSPPVTTDNLRNYIVEL